MYLKANLNTMVLIWPWVTSSKLLTIWNRGLRKWLPSIMYKIIFLIGLSLLTSFSHARGTYQAPAEFVAEVFQGQAPKAQTMWMTGSKKVDVKKIMGHDLPSLRVRYWRIDQRSVWILEEIGKEKPITVGVVVHQGKIEQLKVLAFRESRGDEVRYPFFTQQFIGLGLQQDKQLSEFIDGISGATLSVRALTKIARLALYLHSHSHPVDDAS